MLRGGAASSAESVRGAGASGPPSRFVRYAAIPSAANPPPAATTTLVVVSILRVSAGAISIDDGTGTTVWMGRSAVAGVGTGAVVGLARPHAAATTHALSIARRRTAL